MKARKKSRKEGRWVVKDRRKKARKEGSKEG